MIAGNFRHLQSRWETPPDDPPDEDELDPVEAQLEAAAEAAADAHYARLSDFQPANP